MLHRHDHPPSANYEVHGASHAEYLAGSSPVGQVAFFIDLQTAEDERAYNLARAQVNLETEIVALNKLKGYDPAADLAVTRADLESATISLARAQGRYDAVAHEPDIAMRPEAQALQEATLAYERALAAHNQAVRQGEQRAYDVQAQEKRVELARLEVERLQAGVDPRLEQAVAKAELDLADLRAQITDTLILAPFDGEVTAINTAAGRSVEGFRPVIVVADPRELEVTAELSSDDMGELTEGQEARVVPVGFPGRGWRAPIGLRPYPSAPGGSAPDDAAKLDGWLEATTGAPRDIDQSQIEALVALGLFGRVVGDGRARLHWRVDGQAPGR